MATPETKPYFDIIKEGVTELEKRTIELSQATTELERRERADRFHNQHRAIRRAINAVVATVQQEHEFHLVDRMKERLKEPSKEVEEPSDK